MVDTLPRRSRFASCKLVVRGDEKDVEMMAMKRGDCTAQSLTHNLVGEKALPFWIKEVLAPKGDVLLSYPSLPS